MRVVCRLLLPALLSALAATSNAQVEAKTAPRIWRICVGDQPILPYISNDPRRLGRAERLLVEAGKAADLSVMLQRYPFRRCRNLLASGDSDMAIAGPAPDNFEELRFPMKSGALDPERRIARVNMVWIKRPESAIDWDGQRFTGLPDGHLPHVSLRAGQRVTAHAVRELPLQIDSTALTAKLQLRMLAAGRIDLVLGIQEEFELALADPELKPLVVLPRALLREDFYAVISQKHAAALLPMAERMWTAIARLRDQPEFQRD